MVECWSGPDEGRYDEEGEAATGLCVNSQLETCKTTDEYCAGKKGANYVYMIQTQEHQKIHRIEYDRRKKKRSIRHHRVSRGRIHKAHKH